MRSLRGSPLVPAVAVAAFVLAACGGPAPTPEVAPTAQASVAASPSPQPSIGGIASPSSSAEVPSPGAGAAVEDPSLLDVLPATVSGQPVTLESIAFTEAVADPTFARNVDTAAFGVVVANQDLASAVVAKPADGVWSEAWYRDWRDTYDRGACAQAGGLAATAETDVDGRKLYVGTCAGGLQTYHTWLERRGVLVSAFGIGDGRFGELLMAGLRP